MAALIRCIMRSCLETDGIEADPGDSDTIVTTSPSHSPPGMREISRERFYESDVGRHDSYLPPLGFGVPPLFVGWSERSADPSRPFEPLGSDECGAEVTMAGHQPPPSRRTERTDNPFKSVLNRLSTILGGEARSSSYTSIGHNEVGPESTDLDEETMSQLPSKSVEFASDAGSKPQLLRAASSFQLKSGEEPLPTIHFEQVVVPGSDLQKQMACAMASKADKHDDECVICMETFDESNPRMPTICDCGENKTFFHLACLYEWVKKDRNCPSCRAKLHWTEF